MGSPPAPEAASPALAPAPPLPPPPAQGGESCPDGMVLVPGGPAELGESDPDLAKPYSPNTVVPRGRYELASYCIDTFPLPGRAGDPWPTSGITPAGIRTVEAMLHEHGRRLCTVAELMRAAGGAEGLRYPWGDDPAAPPVCDPDDESPQPLGTFAGCASPAGLRDLQVRSTWARLDPVTEAALTKAGAHTQPGFGGYTVWGGLVRQDTYYAPTNFGVHFHPGGAGSYTDDGLRTCAWPGAPPTESEAWQRRVERLRRDRSLEGLAAPLATPGE